MSYTKPGRLYRTLERIGVPTPLLNITGDTFDVTDGTISNVSINHGGTDPSPGVQPSTCETLLQRPSWIKTGENFTVKLTTAAASALAAHTGTLSVRIIDRYSGRVGSQINEDSHDRLTARLKAASWSAQLGRVNFARDFSAGQTVGWAVENLLQPPALPQIDAQTFGPWDDLAGPLTDATYRDNIDKMTADIGVLARDTRQGRIEVWSLPYRRQWALQQMDAKFPLTRSQAISPATWEQPNEDLPAKVRADWINADGTVRSRSSGGTPDSVVERHDWLHIRDRTGALDMRFEALVSQQWNRVFRVPSIKVDLLYLLATGKEYHRRQVGMLLELNPGDTVGLSGEWNSAVQGMHIASGIDERITQDEWSLTLSLIPFYDVFGEPSPPVPARIWESAHYPWADETRTWNL